MWILNAPRCRSLRTSLAFALAAAFALTSTAGCSISPAGVEPPIAPPTRARTENPNEVRPYADMFRVLGMVTSIPVRGRIVMEKGQPDLRASTPLREASQNEGRSAAVEIAVLDKDGAERLILGRTRAGSEGYLDVTFQVKKGTLEPGLHRLEARIEGRPAGQTLARLLDPEAAGVVVRSDIDLTYLDTLFTRKRDILRLMTQSAAERKTLPAMERVYSALRAGAAGSEDRPLVFISGSPRFFKRVLEARSALDGVEQDGIFLKAFDEIAESKTFVLQFDRIAPALKEQVGYKLIQLIRGRLRLPPKVTEILMGDDSEADFVVYSIYHRFIAGEIDIDGLDKELTRAGVDPVTKREVEELSSKLRAELGVARLVRAIYINRTGSPNTQFLVDEWPVPGVLRYHTGAWPLILDLLEEGLVSREHATDVQARLVELGQSSKDLDEAAQAGVKSGFLTSETLVSFR